MKKIILITALLITSLSTQAQTTAIPDPVFEQVLIDRGIDSDATINGQVATSDLQTVEKLVLCPYYELQIEIQDLTGIQDFTSLKILNVSKTLLSELDLSKNVLLEELYCNSGATDVITLEIESIDLSNNPNIRVVEAMNSPSLSSINLQNGNNMNMDQFQLNIYFEGWPGPDGDGRHICLQVDDKNAAQQNEYPYSSWVIDDYNGSYSYSENCALGINTFQQENIHVYPNPIQNFLNINTPNIELEKIIIYNVQGKKIKIFSENLDQIDMRSLSPGVYFVELVSGKSGIVKKVVKE